MFQVRSGNGEPAKLLCYYAKRRNPSDEAKAEDCFKVEFKVGRDLVIADKVKRRVSENPKNSYNRRDYE